MQNRSLGRINFSRWFTSGLGSQESYSGDSLNRYAVLLRDCGNAGDYDGGKRVHEKLLEDGLFGRFLGNLLVEMYGKCGSVEDACSVFNRISRKNVFTWNMMAGAYIHNGYNREVLRLYRFMCMEGVDIDVYTLLAVVSACASLGSLEDGKLVHASIRESSILQNSLVGGSLVSMYGKCGCISCAESVFESMHNKTTVTWNTMLAVYSQNNLSIHAVGLYRRLLQEGITADSVTFISLLNALASLGSLEDAKALHEQVRQCGFEGDLNLGNTLVNMYGKCRSCSDAWEVFNRMAVKGVVSWTAMISACQQNDCHQEALQLFEKMDVEPDRVVFVTALDSCSCLCELEAGRRVHRHAKRLSKASSTLVGNALVQMYGKCGALAQAVACFMEIEWRDLQSWGYLISAYAQNGHGQQALDVYAEMLLEGFKPNEFTLTHVLDSCSHLGLESKARSCFICMVEDYEVEATVEHYGCIVDLLGRLGRLDEAEEIVRDYLPHQADGVVWLILLSACRMHGDVERGSLVASRVDCDASAYVLLWNSINELA